MGGGSNKFPPPFVEHYCKFALRSHSSMWAVCIGDFVLAVVVAVYDPPPPLFGGPRSPPAEVAAAELLLPRALVAEAGRQLAR